MNLRRFQIIIIVLLLLYLIVVAMLAWPAQESAPGPLGTPVPTTPQATELARPRRTPNPTARILLRTATIEAVAAVTTEAAPAATSGPAESQATASSQPPATATVPAATATSTATRRPSRTPLPTASQTRAPTNTATATVEASPTPTIHVVAKGEVLSAIAKRYGVSVAAIAAANELTNPDALKIGQALLIPLPPTPSPTPS
jgi:LysM repeat protein